MKYNWHFFINPKRPVLNSSAKTPWVWAYSDNQVTDYSSKITTTSAPTIVEGHYKEAMTMHRLAKLKRTELMEKRDKGYCHVITINHLDSFHGASPNDPLTEEGLWLTPMIIATFLQVMAQYFMRKETLLADKWLDSIIKKILSDSYTETLGARYHAYLNPHKANIGQCLSRFGNTHYQFGDYALADASLWNSSTPVMIPIDPMVDLSRLPRGLVCPVW